MTPHLKSPSLAPHLPDLREGELTSEQRGEFLELLAQCRDSIPRDQLMDKIDDEILRLTSLILEQLQVKGTRSFPQGS